MDRVTINGTSYAVPFRKLFRPHTSSEYDGLKKDIEANGVMYAGIVGISPTHGRIVIDGDTRAQIAEEIGARMPVADLGEVDDLWAENRAKALNIHRRHLTREECATLIETMRKQGKSERAIAETLSKSKTFVHSVLNSVGHERPPDSDDDELPIAEEIEEGLPAKITGRDGKKYPIARVARPVVMEEPDGLDDAASSLLIRNARKYVDLLHDTVAGLLDGPRRKDVLKFARDHGVIARGNSFTILEAVRKTIHALHNHG